MSLRRVLALPALTVLIAAGFVGGAAPGGQAQVPSGAWGSGTLTGAQLASLVALMRETPKGTRRWFLLGALAVVPFRASAKHHFKWASEQARTNPAWWNRALR